MLGIPLDLVLPDSHDTPPGSAERLKVAAVSCTVERDLAPPEVRNLLLPGWETESMPKVTIDEHRHVVLREDDVGPTGEILDVFSEPDSSFLKKRPQSPLQICIPVPDAGHAVATLLLREIVGHPGAAQVRGRIRSCATIGPASRRMRVGGRAFPMSSAARYLPSVRQIA